MTYGLAPVREILQNTSEEFLLHPIVEDKERIYAAIASQQEEKDEKEEDVNFYTEYYKFHEKGCNYWNCPIHFGDFRKNPWEKQWVLLDESISHPKVIKMAKLHKMKKLLDYSTASLMLLEMMGSMNALDNPHYYDELQ